jgi:putative ABC transport system permease protein
MLINYLKMAWKVLLRKKFFTFVSLFGISFTLMVLIPVTAYIDSVVSASPPESRIDRILFVEQIELDGKEGSRSTGGPTYYFLNRYVRTLKTPSLVSIYSGQTVNFYHANSKIKLLLKYTDENFWKILDFTFVEGRPYTVSEVNQAALVAVISEKMKGELFGAESAIGKTIELEHQTFRIEGVVNNANKNRESYADVWLPVTTSKGEEFTKFRYLGGHRAMVLAASTSDLENMKKEFRTVVEKAEKPERWKKIICPMKSNIEWMEDGNGSVEDETSGFNFIERILLTIVMFLMLPTVNLININVSRMMDRASEIAIRKSFGATSRMLVLQFLVENSVITVLGSIIGLALGVAALNAVNSFTDLGLSINYRIIVSYSVITIFFGLLSGVFPAYKMSRLKPVDGLKGAVR